MGGTNVFLRNASGPSVANGDGFLRIMTNSRLPGERFTPEETINFVEQWFSQPNIQLIPPSNDHWPLFRKMIIEGQAQGPLVTDAQTAALVVEFGGVLHTVDRDFARFPKLRWKNPLTVAFFDHSSASCARS